MGMPNYTTYTLEQLAFEGDVSLHNIGRDWWLLKFKPDIFSYVYEGQGSTINEAVKGLRVFKENP